MERIAAPETLHLEAYEEYAQGRQQFHAIGKESLERARRHLERAVGLDPNYALAYAALGATYAMRYIHRTDPADLDYAVRYSERAIELDHEIGEPYTWLGYAYMRQGKIEQAIGAGRKGVELQPDLVLAHYFSGPPTWWQRRATPTAITRGDASFGCDGDRYRWVATWLCLGQLAAMCGEYDHAQQYLLSGLELQRRGPGFGYFIGTEMVLATVTQRRGEIAKARDIYASAAASFESCDHVYREAFLALTACGLGDLLRREAHFDAALTEFRRASRLVQGCIPACWAVSVARSHPGGNERGIRSTGRQPASGRVVGASGCAVDRDWSRSAIVDLGRLYRTVVLRRRRCLRAARPARRPHSIIWRRQSRAAGETRIGSRPTRRTGCITLAEPASGLAGKSQALPVLEFRPSASLSPV